MDLWEEGDEETRGRGRGSAPRASEQRGRLAALTHEAGTGVTLLLVLQRPLSASGPQAWDKPAETCLYYTVRPAGTRP